MQPTHPCPNAFPDIDPKYWNAEGTHPELRAFLENGGTNHLKELWERQAADQKAEGARKHEETQAGIRASNLAKAEAIANAATAEAAATEAAGNTEQEQGSDLEDDEIMDTLLSPENLALLTSSDVDGRRAVWKRVVKAKTMQKKLSGKRG